MLRLVSLNNHPSGIVRAPCPARDLRNQLERPLRAAVIGQVQRHIRRDHADQRNLREIQPLRDHLCADHHVRLARSEPPEQLFVRVLFTGGVHVHAHRPRIRKKAIHLFLDLLRARAEILDIPSFAFGASHRRKHLIAAVMAFQQIFGLVIRHRHIALRAFNDVSARAAGHERRMPAAIDEQHCLLARVQTIAQRRSELSGENRMIAPFKFAAHIDQLDLRHGSSHHALTQFDQCKPVFRANARHRAHIA